jgi:hypothetical protein
MTVAYDDQELGETQPTAVEIRRVFIALAEMLGQSFDQDLHGEVRARKWLILKAATSAIANINDEQTLKELFLCAMAVIYGARTVLSVWTAVYSRILCVLFQNGEKSWVSTFADQIDASAFLMPFGAIAGLAKIFGWKPAGSLHR